MKSYSICQATPLDEGEKRMGRIYTRAYPIVSGV